MRESLTLFMFDDFSSDQINYKIHNIDDQHQDDARDEHHDIEADCTGRGMGMPSMMIIVRPMMNMMNIKMSRADG